MEKGIPYNKKIDAQVMIFNSNKYIIWIKFSVSSLYNKKLEVQ